MGPRAMGPPGLFADGATVRPAATYRENGETGVSHGKRGAGYWAGDVAGEPGDVAGRPGRCRIWQRRSVQPADVSALPSHGWVDRPHEAVLEPVGCPRSRGDVGVALRA